MPNEDIIELGKDFKVNPRGILELPGFDPSTLTQPSRRFETTPEERRERTVEDQAQEIKNQMLAEFLKDPENQKKAGRMALELGLSVGAAMATQGASTGASYGEWAPFVASLGTRMLMSGAGGATGSLISETFDPTKNPLKTAGATAAWSALGEAFPGSAGARVARGGTPLEVGGREAIEQIEAMGGHILPGQVSTSFAADVPQAIAESSLFGGELVRKVKQKTIDLATDAVEAFVRRFKQISSKEAMEDLVAETLRGGSEAFRATGKAMYRELDDAVAAAGKEIRVDLAAKVRRPDGTFGSFIEELEKARHEVGNQGARRIWREIKSFIKPARTVDTGLVDDMGQPILKEIPADYTVSFADAQDIRSFILGIGRQGQDLVASGAQATGKRLSPLADGAIAKAAREAGGDVLTLFRDANKWWKNGVKIFNSKLVRALTKEDPRAVLSALGNNPRAIRLLRSELKDTEAWSDVQGEFLWDLLNRASDQNYVRSGEKILKQLKIFGNDAFVAMFSSNELDTLRRLARTLELSQQPVGRGVPGRIFIQLKQAGAVSELPGIVLGASGAVNWPSAAVILLSPAVFARILRNPAASHYLTVGLKSRPGTQQGIRAFGQLVAWLAKEGLEAPVTSGKERTPKTRMRTPLQFSATLGGPRQPMGEF